jgi:hypothetical protein
VRPITHVWSAAACCRFLFSQLAGRDAWCQAFIWRESNARVCMHPEYGKP